MASIIRSPDISQEKRKLASRRAKDIVAQAVSEAFPTAAQQPASAPVMAQSSEPAQPLQPVAAKPAPQPDINALVEQARQSVLEQFKAEGEKARELGRQRGLQEGREAGAEEAKKSFEADLARVRSIADKLQQVTESGIKGMEDIAVAIAFEAVCKMMGSAAVSREGILALVQEAASHAVASEGVTVRLHPGDLAALQSAGALDPALASGDKVEWVADKEIVLGGCVVETDSGDIDARLETQIAALRKTLLQARRKSQ